MKNWLLLIIPLVCIGCSESGPEDRSAVQPDEQTPAYSDDQPSPQASPAPEEPEPADKDIGTETEIVTEEIEYRVNDQPFTGYLAYGDNIEGKRPGVLVVHEWWGHNDYARNRAEQLARMGYTAFALDMYGAGKVTEHPGDAQKFLEEATKNPEQAKERFLKAKQLLEEHPTTHADKTAAIGYCFGGGVVLNMARAGVDLDGVASFHGSLAPMFEAEAGDIEASILVLHGGDDEMVPEDQVKAFKEEMDNANADYEFINYPGAKHSFTNPDATAVGEKHDMPLAYDAEADRKSWAELKDFLEALWTEEAKGEESSSG